MTKFTPFHARIAAGLLLLAAATASPPVAVAVPLTVIVCECQMLEGPSEIGPIGVLRVDRSGAPQPARAAASTALSDMIGLAMSDLDRLLARICSGRGSPQ